MRYITEALLAGGVLMGVMLLGGTAAHAGGQSDWNHDWRGGDDNGRWEHSGDRQDGNNDEWDGNNKDWSDRSGDECDKNMKDDNWQANEDWNDRADDTSYANKREDDNGDWQKDHNEKDKKDIKDSNTRYGSS